MKTQPLPFLPPFHFPVIVLGILLAGLFPAAAAVRVEQADDRSVRVTAESYQAAFDAQGNWTSLVINGKEMLAAGMKFPGKEAASSINVRTHLLAIRNEKVILEFSFEPKGFDLSLQGSGAQIGLAKSVSALVTAKQGSKGPDSKNVPDVRKVIVDGVAFDLNPGLVYRAGNLLVFPPRQGQTTSSVRFECGVSAATENLVELADFQPVGPAGKTVAEIPGGTPVRLQAIVRNLSGAEIAPTLVYTVANAYSGGKTSAPVTLPATPLAAGASQTVEIPLEGLEPGIHWVNLELRKGENVIQRERTSLVYDGANFRPPLTRPADFSDFWKSRLEAMRRIPLDAQVTEVPDRSTAAAVHYEVQIAGPAGQPIKLQVQAPRKTGEYPAIFGGKMPEKASNAAQIQLVFPHKEWPEEATYNRWVSAQDNNHVDCYLLAVRITDYLRSRPDVGRIFLFGASRQGPIQLANAALDPTKIVAVDAHVPTSMGLSWEAQPYKGWGKTPSPASMGAYVDPVNFAPDIRVPVMLDEGVYDGLSPAPGALAFINHAVNAPWKRLSIEPGGHGFFTSGFRPSARKELETFLGFPLEGGVDEAIMREH